MAFSRITFDEAIAETEGVHRHLLLGNGFSIDGYAGFSYDNLAERACAEDSSLREIFTRHKTTDFEVAMNGAKSVDEKERIRSAFLDTITKIHPRRDHAVNRDQRQLCADFLGKFLRANDKPLRGRVFTTNYDIMLYWVLVEFKSQLGGLDGFDPQERWNAMRMDRTYVHYLHGGLHIYRVPGRQPTTKVTPTVKFATLMDSIRSKVQGGDFPVIVAEQSHEAKLRVIESDEDYLQPIFQRFKDTCGIAGDVLFAFGHSLSPRDHHLSSAIARGCIGNVYISAFDKRNEAWLEKLEDRWSRFRKERGLPPLHVKVYASRDVPVWRPARFRVHPLAD